MKKLEIKMLLSGEIVRHNGKKFIQLSLKSVPFRSLENYVKSIIKRNVFKQKLKQKTRNAKNYNCWET